MRSLEDHNLKVRAKTIARGAVKYTLTHAIAAKVAENNGDTAGLFVKKLLTAAASGTELADKRSWQTLPDQILMARLTVPEGMHDLTVTFTDANGNSVATRTLTDVVVKKGHKTFVSLRTMQ
jgi:hypothetical protein